MLVLHYDFFLILLILWVLHAVMAEVKGLCGLNDLSEPSAEISVIYLRGFLRVLHFDQYLENVEIELRVSA